MMGLEWNDIGRKVRMKGSSHIAKDVVAAILGPAL